MNEWRVSSTLKFATDILSTKWTAILFTGADGRLVDLVIAALSQLNAGDNTRTDYLRILQLLMRNTGYLQHMYRVDDVCRHFVRILLDPDLQANTDQQLIREMNREFGISVENRPYAL